MAGSYGSSSLIPKITVDKYGRVTSVTTVDSLKPWTKVWYKTISGSYDVNIDLSSYTEMLWQLNTGESYYWIVDEAAQSFFDVGSNITIDWNGYIIYYVDMGGNNTKAYLYAR